MNQTDFLQVIASRLGLPAHNDLSCTVKSLGRRKPFLIEVSRGGEVIASLENETKSLWSWQNVREIVKQIERRGL